MANLFISEYLETATDYEGRQVMAGKEPAIATQVVGIVAGHSESNPFTSGTKFVRLHTDVKCNIQIGLAPVAVIDVDARMAANQTEFFAVTPGHSVSVLLGS